MSVLEQVYLVMADGWWRSPYELCNELCLRFSSQISDAGVTARLRDLRKPKFGGNTVHCRKRNRVGNTREYQLVLTGMPPSARR